MELNFSENHTKVGEAFRIVFERADKSTEATIMVLVHTQVTDKKTLTKLHREFVKLLEGHGKHVCELLRENLKTVPDVPATTDRAAR